MKEVQLWKRQQTSVSSGETFSSKKMNPQDNLFEMQVVLVENF